MAVGLSIQSTGQIVYGNGTIVSNVTKSLLSVFTNVPGAVPDVMSPDQFVAISSPEPYYGVANGPYANEYVINRNDPAGEIFFNNWLTTGQFNIDYFHDYAHWTKDQRLKLNVVNGTFPTQFYSFKLTIPNFGIICNLSGVSQGYFYSLGVYQNLQGNIAGAGGVPSEYSTPQINTNWDLTWTVEYDPSNNLRGSFRAQIQITDFHTGDLIYQNSVDIGGLNSGFPSFVENTITVDYWRCLGIEVIMT